MLRRTAITNSITVIFIILPWQCLQKTKKAMCAIFIYGSVSKYICELRCALKNRHARAGWRYDTKKMYASLDNAFVTFNLDYYTRISIFSAVIDLVKSYSIFKNQLIISISILPAINHYRLSCNEVILF